MCTKYTKITCIRNILDLPYISSYALLDACKLSGASSDIREPISLHQAAISRHRQCICEWHTQLVFACFLHSDIQRSCIELCSEYCRHGGSKMLVENFLRM